MLSHAHSEKTEMQRPNGGSDNEDSALIYTAQGAGGTISCLLIKLNAF